MTHNFLGLRSNSWSDVRLDIIDDTSGRIQYTDGWLSQRHGLEAELRGERGPRMNHTSHSLNSTSGSFSFVFNSSSYVDVLGTLTSQRLSGVGELNNAPSWICYIKDHPDHEYSQLVQKFEGDVAAELSNVNICNISVADIGPGPHELIVNVTSSAPGSFALDGIAYTAVKSSDKSEPELETGIVQIPVKHKSVTMSPGWEFEDFNRVWMANETGEHMSLSFTGTGVIVRGTTTNGKAVPAEYSLDGAAFTAIPETDVSRRESVRQSSAALVELPRLEYKPHELVIRFLNTSTDGNEIQPQLELLDFIVSSPPASGSSDAPGGGPGDTGRNGGKPSGPPLPAIIGAIAGGVVLILLILFGILFLRRRRRKRSAAPSTFRPTQQTGPYPYQPQPSSSEIASTPSTAHLTVPYQEPPVPHTLRVDPYTLHPPDGHPMVISPAKYLMSPGTPSPNRPLVYPNEKASSSSGPTVVRMTYNDTSAEESPVSARLPYDESSPISPGRSTGEATLVQHADSGIRTFHLPPHYTEV